MLDQSSPEVQAVPMGIAMVTPTPPRLSSFARLTRSAAKPDLDAEYMLQILLRYSNGLIADCGIGWSQSRWGKGRMGWENENWALLEMFC